MSSEKVYPGVPFMRSSTCSGHEDRIRGHQVRILQNYPESPKTTEARAYFSTFQDDDELEEWISRLFGIRRSTGVGR